MKRLPPLLRSVSPAELAERLAAERRGAPFLLYLDGDARQHIVDLGPARGALSIGRDGASDIPLEWDTEVSRAHAVLERIGGAWTLVDDGLSRNGSSVNGRRVYGRRRLDDGDCDHGRADAARLRRRPGAGADDGDQPPRVAARALACAAARAARPLRPAARGPVRRPAVEPRDRGRALPRASRRSRATCTPSSSCSGSGTCRRTASAPSSSAWHSSAAPCLEPSRSR